MTRVTTTPLAVSADYADALLTARRAKNWLFLLLLLGLLAQISIFALVRFKVIKFDESGEATVTVPKKVEVESPATAPTTNETTPAAAEVEVQTKDVTPKVGGKNVTADLLAWVVNSIVYLGTILSVVFMIVLLLIVMIMLVGRLLGVAHTTSAFIWAVILFALLFPWQMFQGQEHGSYPGSHSTSAALTTAGANDFRVPGVLYTWRELRDEGNFPSQPLGNAILKWARFAGFPILALIILFMVQAKSGRGVKFALGEAEVHVDVATTDTDLR
jgi:hypothetical protein